ncbi:MAG: 2Fe-2S iron-sulfur cluster-binding protein [Roseiflexaceae bacterium]
MPKLEVEGFGSYDVPEGTRLVRALEEQGVDILHRCGGHARCTTCRVTFSAGEPDQITVAEYEKLKERELFGQFRLSCQLLCDRDMSLSVGMTLSSSGLPDPGPQPEEQITPEPQWIAKPSAGS